MLPQSPPIFVLGGRYGDIIQLLGCFKKIHDCTHQKPIVIVGLTIDGWTSSLPKGNCVLEVKYNQTPHRIAEILNTVESFKNKALQAA